MIVLMLEVGGKRKMEREEAINLLKKYNKEEFHIRHAFTVEQIMKCFAKKNNENEEFWGLVRIIT